MICLLNSNSYPCVTNAKPPDSAAKVDSKAGDNHIFDAQRAASLADDQSCRSSPSSMSSDSSNISSSNDDLTQYTLKNLTKSSKDQDSVETEIQTDKKEGWNPLLKVHYEGTAQPDDQEEPLDPYQINFNSLCQTENLIKNGNLLSVTMCNMRQNIFDIRKKKGRKRSRDGISRQNSRRSTTSSEGSVQEVLPIEDEQPACKKFTSSQPVIPEDQEEEESKLDKFNESKSIVADILEDLMPRCDRPLVPQSDVGLVPDEEPKVFVNVDIPNVPMLKKEEEIVEEKDPLCIEDWPQNPTDAPSSKLSDSCDLDLVSGDENSQDLCKGSVEIESCNLGDDSDVQIIEEEEEEQQEEALQTPKPCSIQVTDVFRDSPLTSFSCLGAIRPMAAPVTSPSTLNVRLCRSSVVNAPGGP